MIINCTPHPITIRLDGKDITIEPAGIVPRVSTIEAEAEAIHDIPCVTQRTGAVEGLPEPSEGVYLLVSGMVFNASDRRDLIAPDTGKTCIRDAKGQIVAVTRLLRK